MKKQNNKMPTHAKSFLASGIMTLCTCHSIYKKSDPLSIKLSAAASFLCVADGLYQLHKEDRLGKAFGLPFFQKHLKLTSPDTRVKVTTTLNPSPTPRSRL